MPIASINPATEELLRAFEPFDAGTIQLRLDQAWQASHHLRRAPLEHRALCMRKLAALLLEDCDSLARIITLEMGKPLHAAEAEVRKCADCCLYYADHAARILAPTPIHTAALQSFVQYEPLGVVLAVMPWNFPFWQVFRFAAPALMAANTVLLKHAPSVPQCALLIESLVRRAGFTPGSLSALLVEESQVEAILADARVAALTVTGGEHAGRVLAAQAGWLLKKSVLELGGSDPFLVMPSADLDAALRAAVDSRTLNCGQSCIAAKRFIVHRDLYSEFEQRFADSLSSLRIGDPTRPETQLGPLATERTREILEEQVAACVAAGARILTGGARMVGRGYYFEPTLLTGLPRRSEVASEEIFGPVAVLYQARDLAEAVDIANDTPYGLGASVWTRDPVEQQVLIASMESGMVFLNGIVASDPRLPFGGVKRSGYGRELGFAGMREFLNAKTVVVA